MIKIGAARPYKKPIKIINRCLLAHPMTFLYIIDQSVLEKSFLQSFLYFISEKRHMIKIGAARPYKKPIKIINRCLFAHPMTFLYIIDQSVLEKSFLQSFLYFISEKRHMIKIGAARPYKKLL